MIPTTSHADTLFPLSPPDFHLRAILKPPSPSPSLLGGAQQLQGPEQSLTGGDGAVGASA